MKGLDEWLLRGAEEALEDAQEEVVCEGTCRCGGECLIPEAPKPKLEFYSLTHGFKLN